jgi:hypothetical protein
MPDHATAADDFGEFHAPDPAIGAGREPLAATTGRTGPIAERLAGASGPDGQPTGPIIRLHTAEMISGLASIRAVTEALGSAT